MYVSEHLLSTNLQTTVRNQCLLQFRSQLRHAQMQCLQLHVIHLLPLPLHLNLHRCVCACVCVCLYYLGAPLYINGDAASVQCRLQLYSHTVFDRAVLATVVFTHRV